MTTRRGRKINRVLLVEPPRTAPIEHMERTRPTAQPPLGPAYIAAVLEKNGYEVKILDAIIEDPNCRTGKRINDKFIRIGLEDHKIAEIIREFKPDIVGASCIVSAKYYDAINICKIAKSISKDIITVMGGAHPTMTWEKTITDPDLDYIMIGEADFSTLIWIRWLEGKVDEAELDGVAMKVNGETKHYPKKGYIQDLDKVPFPARHLLKLDKYWDVNLPHGEATRSPWTTIITSRGCPATCIYCSAQLLWGKKYRGRSAENVLAEIKFLIDTYGIKELLIEDDNFSFDKKRTEKILNGIIDNGWDISWTTPSGIAIFALTPELLGKIRQSGCHSITLAVESGSQRVLTDIIKKPLLMSKVEEIGREAKKIGLKTKAFYLLGVPGETKMEMEQTIEVARKLRLDWSCFSITTPLPGTALYQLCKDKGYIEGDIDPINVEYSTARIKTAEWDESFVNAMWEKGNNINFFDNPNLDPGGNVDQAIFDFNRVIRMVPNHQNAHYALGLAYEKKGMIEEAIKEWEFVLSVNEDHKLAADCMDRIRNIAGK